MIPSKEHALDANGIDTQGLTAVLQGMAPELGVEVSASFDPGSATLYVGVKKRGGCRKFLTAVKGHLRRRYRDCQIVLVENPGPRWVKKDGFVRECQAEHFHSSQIDVSANCFAPG